MPKILKKSLAQGRKTNKGKMGKTDHIMLHIKPILRKMFSFSTLLE
jgi:hypothetical protein